MCWGIGRILRLPSIGFKVEVEELVTAPVFKSMAFEQLKFGVVLRV